MTRFIKAHAYGNDFLYLLDEGEDEDPRKRGRRSAEEIGAMARELCDRHTGIGADGLVLYKVTSDGASMRLFNADGSRSEVSGNGVRALGAILLRDDARTDARLVIHTDAGAKSLTRIARSGSRQTFRAAMGLPGALRQVRTEAAGETLDLVVMDFGNPQCVVIGPLPAESRFRRIGAALERHELFPSRTNVEFAEVERPDAVRILIWERGVGPTTSSGTGACATLIASALYGGAAKSADVVSPGGTQRVEWCEDSVYLTGWAEVLVDGTWLRAMGPAAETGSAY